MLPFFPRDIDNYTFYINPHLNEEKLTEACAHETLHFYGLSSGNPLSRNS